MKAISSLRFIALGLLALSMHANAMPESLDISGVALKQSFESARAEIHERLDNVEVRQSGPEMFLFNDTERWALLKVPGEDQLGALSRSMMLSEADNISLEKTAANLRVKFGEPTFETDDMRHYGQRIDGRAMVWATDKEGNPDTALAQSFNPIEFIEAAKASEPTRAQRDMITSLENAGKVAFALFKRNRHDESLLDVVTLALIDLESLAEPLQAQEQARLDETQGIDF